MPSLFFPVVCAVGQAYSLASFGLRVGSWGLPMCMTAKGWFVCHIIVFIKSPTIAAIRMIIGS